MKNSTSFLNKIKTNRATARIAAALFSLIFWVGVWIIAAALAGNSLIFPSPLDVISRLYELVATSDFWLAVAVTLFRITAGLAAGVILAIPLAVLTHRFSVANTLTSPLLTIIRATPVTSFILLAFFWFDKSTIPVFTSFLMVFPIMWAGIATGLESVPQELIEMTQVFRFPLWRRITKLYIPAVSPDFRSSLITSIGLSWKAGVAAEIIAIPRLSIGRNMYEAKVYLETPDLFAWTAVVVILSLIFERLLTRLLKGNNTNRGVKEK
ncbi:MAG TPA: ABC transporter permease subunit [Bacillota bacterium]|nr:ABC transporter permease subunit [Bacillota bacterium]